jgi:hypothetical protein
MKKIKGSYKLTINLNIDFRSYDDFYRFLNNVENKISINSDKNLYQIQSLSYDIVNYQKPQSVNININVYFYK